MNKIFTPNPKNLLRAKFNDERKESCLCSNNLLVVFGKIIILVLFMLGSNACAILKLTTPIIPMPTLDQLSATNDTKQTHSAILAAVRFKEWKVEDDSEGQIKVYKTEVIRQGKVRMAAIRITYDEYVVGFHYLLAKISSVSRQLRAAPKSIESMDNGSLAFGLELRYNSNLPQYFEVMRNVKD